MATEKDFELLDDYLSGKLSQEDKLAFEQKLGSDPELKRELEFQRQVVKSIQQERVKELKSMLNQVPVPASSGAGTSFMAKLSAALAVVALVSAGIYFLLNNEDKTDGAQKPSQEQVEADQQEKPSSIASSPSEEPEERATEQGVIENQEESGTEATQPVPSEKNQSTNTKGQKNTEQKESQEVRQPALNVFDPSDELNDSEPEDNTVIIQNEEPKEKVTSSSITVETDNTNKKYDFHYEFRQGNLMLYGSFDKKLIEILEFFSGNKRTIFLYFNSNYYLLDENQTTPSLLKPITDPVLLNKLKEYRNK